VKHYMTAFGCAPGNGFHHPLGTLLLGLKAIMTSLAAVCIESSRVQ
jgi:hypothetical protein